MRNWLLFGAAGAVLGYAAVHFAFSGSAAPEPEQARLPAPAPDEPLVLAQVVDVTGVEQLLDPRPAAPAGLPFDAGEPLEPAAPVNKLTPAAPTPIPPAVD